tara:strand:+ start:6835 stop:7443 length:609 start_codon:yes stop_codon:yes gene_type:complete
MEIKIYGLYDPRDSKIRYIGRTKSLLKRRLSQHLSKARHSYNNSHKENWIRFLLKNGITPKIKLLTTLETSWEDSHEFEKVLIEKYWKKHKLVNGVDAGPGTLLKNTSEGNEKIRIEKIKEHFNIEENKKNFYNTVYAYNLDGTFYKEFKSVSFIETELGIPKQKVSNHMSKFHNQKLKVRPINNLYFCKYKVDVREMLCPL